MDSPLIVKVGEEDLDKLQKAFYEVKAMEALKEAISSAHKKDNVLKNKKVPCENMLLTGANSNFQTLFAEVFAKFSGGLAKEDFSMTVDFIGSSLKFKSL